MANIYIVNAGVAFGFAKGELNGYLTQVATDTLGSIGHTVKFVSIAKGYVAQQEVENILWADSIIYQQPAWWMGGPWELKKYMDDVFSLGAGSLYQDDGRTRNDLSKKYGSGGRLQSKTYMISATWNAPLEAFEDPDQFFEGKGADAVYFAFHKANQFLGMSALPTFLCTDIIKNPKINADVKRYKAHLNKYYPASSN